MLLQPKPQPRWAMLPALPHSTSPLPPPTTGRRQRATALAVRPRVAHLDDGQGHATSTPMLTSPKKPIGPWVTRPNVAIAYVGRHGATPSADEPRESRSSAARRAAALASVQFDVSEGDVLRVR